MVKNWQLKSFGKSEEFHKPKVHLRCSQCHFISFIKFACFGTPLGICGSFQQGTCHAPTSYSLLEKAFNHFANVPEVLGGPMAEIPGNLLHTNCVKNDSKIESPMETAFDSENQGKMAPFGDSCLTSSTSDIKQANHLESAVPACLSPIITTRYSSEVNYLTPYVNYYSFAQVASAVAEDVMHDSSDKSNSNSVKSVEEIISTQRMSILKKYSYFCWPNISNANSRVQKENCGWCYSCRTPEEGKDCFLKMNGTEPVLEGCKSEVHDIQSKQNRKGHLVNVLCYILGLEDRLCGLLRVHGQIYTILSIGIQVCTRRQMFLQ